MMEKTVAYIPADALERVEFDKLLDWCSTQCCSELGRDAVLALRPSADFHEIQSRLSEVRDGMMVRLAGKQIPLDAFSDIRPAMPLLAVQDSVLGLEEILDIWRLLSLTDELVRFLSGEDLKEANALKAIASALYYEREPLELLAHYLDEEGEIRESASPELKRIRSSIRSKMREADQVFQAALNRHRKAGLLAEAPESMKGGRRVLSVPAEHKRRVRGIIHDESASGKTVFIEPEEVIPVHNDIVELHAEERREIYKILRALCTGLRVHIPALLRYQEALVRVDVIRALVACGMSLKGIVPAIHDRPMFKWYNARHPLLFMKNKELGKRTVPFNYELRADNRLMILSGPNAGGKSVTMKAMGLIQLMLQSGFPVPLDEGSECGIFHKIFVDIGDQQSLEDDLSTYSSRLTNMKNFIEHSDDRTLVLIDEFGTGTDPKFGGAMAESILFALNKKSVFGIVTTHFSNLKQFAYKHKGLLNGSMNFDREKLSPSYELIVGKPGSSFTFEIAEKVGMPPSILQAARKKAGSEAVSFDELLIKLQEEKTELSSRIEQLEQKQKDLDRLIANYEALMLELQVQRKKLKLEVKTQKLHDEAERNRLLEKYMRELREQQNVARLKEEAEAQRQVKRELAEEIKGLREDLSPVSGPEVLSELVPGAFAKLLHSGQTGEVISVSKKQAELRVGALRMRVQLKDLVPVKSHIDTQQGGGVSSKLLESHASFNPRLDVRGMRREELIRMLELYLDEAMLAGVHSFQIVHGKGNGVLKKAVRETLKSYPHELRYSHPEDAAGGTGVTLVEVQ